MSDDMQVTLTGEPTQEQKPRYKREEWLREQYVEQRKTAIEIGDMADCSGTTVRKYLNKHGIETRTGGLPQPDKPKDKGWLREQYVEQGKTTYEIADMANCDSSTVRKYLNKHGIEIRKGGGWQTPGKLNDKGWLREQYVEQGKTTDGIADMADCTDVTVLRYLNKHGIETRPNPAGLSGADHPQYAGGDSAYGSGWNETKKCAVRERDGNACRNCGMSQEQHRRQYDQRLHVHHITKAREFDDADKRNAMNNLIALCRDCHHGHFERMAATGLQPQIPGVNYPNE